MMLAAVLCCAMTTTVFTACSNNDDVTYLKSYMYEVKLDATNSVGYSEEAIAITNALNTAIGFNGNYYSTLQSPKDSEMKSKCDAIVKQQYSNIKSAYLVFNLYRITLDATPGSEKIAEVISTYEIGKALTQPYVTYTLSTNSDNAFAALEAKRATLDEKVYKASRQTLTQLVGYHKNNSGVVINSSSLFESHLKNILGVYYPESQSDEQYISNICDSISQAHKNDTLAVEAVVKLSTIGLINKKEKMIWGHTFPANI